MKDSIILGTGNSRYLKSVEDFKSLYPTYDDFVAALVSGTLPVDFNGINPAGFQQVGNPLGKAALLKDDTAALYGLPNTAVPDDALRLLAPAVSHWWRRRSYQMVEERTALPSGLHYIAYGSNADNCVRDVQYASEVTLSYGGGVELIDPQEVQIKWHGGDAATEVLKGMYVLGTYSHPDDVLYFDTDEVFSINSSSSGYWVRSSNIASYLVSAKAEYGAWEYVHSSDEGAYPHSGAADGYEYEYLGQPYPPKVAGGSGDVSSVNGKTGDVTLTAGDVGAVSVPTTASVGQTVVVKAVDADGKPTEWKAADKLPKSPADWEPWTAEEQAAARDRIGIDKPFELIEEIVCDGEATAYTRTVDVNGNPYNLLSVYIEFEVETGNSYTSAVFFRAYDAESNTVLYDGVSVNQKSYVSYLVGGVDAKNGMYQGWMINGNIASYNIGGSNTKRINRRAPIISPIKKIYITVGGGLKFLSGDKIRIYGVRA